MQIERGRLAANAHKGDLPKLSDGDPSAIESGTSLTQLDALALALVVPRLRHVRPVLPLGLAVNLARPALGECRDGRVVDAALTMRKNRSYLSSARKAASGSFVPLRRETDTS
jgi:hypothetical protein